MLGSVIPTGPPNAPRPLNLDFKVIPHRKNAALRFEAKIGVEWGKFVLNEMY